MKLSTLQIGLSLSLLTHGVIFSAISFIQSGSGTFQTGSSPITFVLISEPVSTDSTTSTPETTLESSAAAPSSSVLNSDESILPLTDSQPISPSPSPEVVSEAQTLQPPAFADDPSEEQISVSQPPVADDTGTPPNISTTPQTSPSTLAPAASPGASPGPSYLYNPAPRYPAKARARGEQGTVIISIRVNSEGLPRDFGVRETSGSDLLDRAALDAVKTWRFAPAQRESRTVETRVEIPIEFKLARTKTP